MVNPGTFAASIVVQRLDKGATATAGTACVGNLYAAGSTPSDQAQGISDKDMKEMEKMMREMAKLQSSRAQK